MNSNTFEICLKYEEGIFKKDEFNEIENEVSEYGLKVKIDEYPMCGKGGIDLLSPILEIISSSDICQEIIDGLAIEGIKLLLIKIFKKFHKKSKKQGESALERMPDIQFVSGQNRFVLPKDVDQEKFEYVVDKFFECVEKSSANITVYYCFDSKNDVIIKKTINEILLEGSEKL